MKPLSSCLVVLLSFSALVRAQGTTSRHRLHNPPLTPADPAKVMVIRQITPEILTCSVPFERYGRIKIGGRATIVRMRTGDLAVFSPLALTDQVKSHISRMGTVKYLIAPDIQHHLFLDPWHMVYPAAKLIGSEELKIKREKMGKPLPWSFVWKKGTPPSVDEEFDHEFEYSFVWSHPNHELVFNHKPSRTLIQADLMFNMPATEQYSKSGVSATTGYLTRAFTFVNNYRHEGIWQQRYIWYVESSRDRPSFDKDMQTISTWDFDRMIPCHGDVIEKTAKEVFSKVFSWHLKGRGREDGTGGSEELLSESLLGLVDV